MRYKVCLSLIGILFVSLAFAQRDTIAINDNWQFKIDKSNEGTTQKWYENNLSNARTVRVPHTWNVETGTEMYYGLAWYQKKLNIPAHAQSAFLTRGMLSQELKCIMALPGTRRS